MNLSTETEQTSSASWLSQVREILTKAGKDFFHENGPQWAAAIAYYSLLSIFPLLLLAVSVAAFIVDPDWAINSITNVIGRFLPSGEVRIGEIVRKAYDARGGTSIVSLLLLLWTGSRVFGVLARALNIAFDASEPYGFFKRLIAELVMVITLGLLYIAALISRFTIRFLWNRLNIFPRGESLWLTIIQELVSAFLLFVVLYLTYRFVPNRTVDSRSAVVGSLISTLVILIARPLFLGYLNWIANYNLIYGSLAIVVILMVWVWILSALVLFGGQITSETQSSHIGESKKRNRE